MNIDDERIVDTLKEPFCYVADYQGVPLNLLRIRNRRGKTVLMGITCAHHSLGRRPDGTIYDNGIRIAYRAATRSSSDLIRPFKPIKPSKSFYHFLYPITKLSNYGPLHKKWDILIVVFDYDIDIPVTELVTSGDFEDSIINIGYPASMNGTMMVDHLQNPEISTDGNFITFKDGSEVGYSGGGVYVKQNGEWKLLGISILGNANSMVALNLLRPDLRQWILEIADGHETKMEQPAVLQELDDRHWSFETVDSKDLIAAEGKYSENKLVMFQNKSGIGFGYWTADMWLSKGVYKLSVASTIEGSCELRVRINKPDRGHEYDICGKYETGHANLYFSVTGNEKLKVNFDLLGEGAIEVLNAELHRISGES